MKLLNILAISNLYDNPIINPLYMEISVHFNNLFGGTKTSLNKKLSMNALNAIFIW